MRLRRIVNRTQRRQARYGGIYGTAVAVLALATTYWIMPEASTGWKKAAFTLLDAHGIEIMVDKRPASALTYPEEVDYLSGGARRALQVFLIMSVAVASILTSISMGWTTRQEYILKNSLYAAGAYSVTAFAILLLSNALPGLRLAIFALLGGALALWVGSTVLQGATGDFPVFGVVSLGGILLVGFLILSVGWALVRVMVPILSISIGGALLGGGAVYIAREYR